MHHSMRPHPAITATLLDFMCRVCMIAVCETIISQSAVATEPLKAGPNGAARLHASDCMQPVAPCGQVSCTKKIA